MRRRAAALRKNRHWVMSTWERVGITSVMIRYGRAREADRKAQRGARTVRAPRGTTLHTKGWAQEGALRMLMNNLDPDVAEKPRELIVYGGTGKAARNWEGFATLVRTLTK